MKAKRSAFLLAALLLAACTSPSKPPAPLPSELPSTPPSPSDMTADEPSPSSTPLPSQGTIFADVSELPRIDGSTACVPLIAAAIAQTTGADLDYAESITSVTTTTQAYDQLTSSETDILIVYEPSEETQRRIEASGVKLDMQPLGRDALVFLINEANSVEALTTAQLIDIYTGKITSWKELGGSDAAIAAFQRDADSGSQALFRKLVMKNVEPMAPPEGLMPGDMGDLIRDLASYQNDANAIGFSVYYYAKNMYALPGLKFAAIDGVAPNDATIGDGSYPFLNDFFVVTRADEPSDSPAAKLRDWLLSDAGRQCLIDAGYVPAN